MKKYKVIPSALLFIAEAVLFFVASQISLIASNGDEILIRKITGIAYAGTDVEEQKLDLYLPQSEQIKNPVPLIIWIHGGGFFEGTRTFCPLKSFAEKGYAVASISYRLAPAWQFPVQLEDCQAAVNWLQMHAKEFGIDPYRVGVCGESAGGLLASLLGVVSPPADLPLSLRVKAMVALCAPTDLTARKATEDEIVALFASNDPALIKEGEKRRWEERVLTNLLGGPLSKKLDVAKAASPYFHVTPDDVPSLLIHGDQDDLVPVTQSEIFAERLHSNQVPVEFHVIKGAGHGFGKPSEAILNLIKNFFDRTLIHDVVGSLE